jgi:hypothetical protein
MNVLRMLIFLLFVGSYQSFAQEKTRKKRLEITLEFAKALQQGTLSNEEIMKRYVVEGSYFKSDSMKQMADEYLNFYRGLKDYEVAAIKYSEHESEYYVVGVKNIGDTSTSPVRLKFTLQIANPLRERQVDINDLYVIKTKPKGGEMPEGGGIFILFNKENKILSFSGMTIGNHTGLMQF